MTKDESLWYCSACHFGPHLHDLYRACIICGQDLDERPSLTRTKVEDIPVSNPTPAVFVVRDRPIAPSPSRPIAPSIPTNPPTSQQLPTRAFDTETPRCENEARVTYHATGGNSSIAEDAHYNNVLSDLEEDHEDQSYSSVSRRRSIRSTPLPIATRRSRMPEKRTKKLSEHSTKDQSGDTRQPLCPYYKRFPEIFKHKRCSHPFDDIPRLKLHLQRNHKLHQCKSCHEFFHGGVSFDAHIKAAKLNGSCGPADSATALKRGYTVDMEKRLTSRKNGYMGASEDLKWERIYMILFPDTDPEQVPSPYKDDDPLSLELVSELPSRTAVTLRTVLLKQVEEGYEYFDLETIDRITVLARIAGEEVLAHCVRDGRKVLDFRNLQSELSSMSLDLDAKLGSTEMRTSVAFHDDWSNSDFLCTDDHALEHDVTTTDAINLASTDSIIPSTPLMQNEGTEITPRLRKRRRASDVPQFPTVPDIDVTALFNAHVPVS